jgi:hypothetical protein
MAELEIAEAWVDMLLTNSRTIFNRVRILSIHPSIIGENYQRAYNAFIACQGTNVSQAISRLPPLGPHLSQVSLKQKLCSLQRDVRTYLHQPMVVLQEDHSAANKKLTAQLQKLIRHCEELEEALGDANDELDEMREQYILLDREKDRTPGALLFFSILSNPKLPEMLSSHLHSLHSVKEIVDGKEHYDYLTLRRHLEGCVLIATPLQQLLKRYHTLHKKWSSQRSKQFFDRKLIGADADALFVCPLCAHDPRTEGIISPSQSRLLSSSAPQSFEMALPTGVRKGPATAMRGVSRGMISSRSMNAPLGGISR